MTQALTRHEGPWTEEDYFQLGETSDRIELMDGSLIVSPAPNRSHQRLSRRLANALEPAAERIGWAVDEAINIRLLNGRILIPDVAVVQTDNFGSVLDVAEVKMVCEVVSPSNAATDWVLKMHLYAAAKIEWYLLAEQRPQIPLTIRLLKLDRDRYLEHASAKTGETLRLAEPFPIVLELSALTR